MQALIRPAAACRRDAVITLDGLATAQDAEDATNSPTTTADPAAFYQPVGAAVLLVDDEPVGATTTTTLVPTMTLRAEWYDGGWVELPCDDAGRYTITETGGHNLFDLRLSVEGTANTSGDARTLTLTFADVDAESTGSAFVSLLTPMVITIPAGATSGSAEQSITLTGDDHYNGHRLFAIGGVWS